MPSAFRSIRSSPPDGLPSTAGIEAWISGGAGSPPDRSFVAGKTTPWGHSAMSRLSCSQENMPALYSNEMVLDVGCGKLKAEPGAVGIDVSPRSAADIVWDLDDFP